MLMRSLPLVLVVAATAIACGEAAVEAAGGPTHTVRDSAGVQIVETALPSDRLVDTLADPLFEIGVVDGDARYQFTSLVDIEPLPDGVAVSDGVTREVRIFGADGAHRVSFGRQGQGPGEFQEAPSLRFVAPDTLIAWDIRQRRLTWFSLEGRVIRDLAVGNLLPANEIPHIYISGAWKLLRDGSMAALDRLGSRALLVDVGEAKSVRLEGLRERSSAELAERPSGAAVLVGSPFFSGQDLDVRLDPPTVWIGDSLKWEVRAYRPNGELARVLRVLEPRVEVSADVIDEARARLGERWRWDADTGILEAAFDKLAHPDSVAAISTVDWAPPDRLLIGRMRLAVRPTTRAFEVFSEEGEWLASLRVPEEAGYFRAAGYGRVFTVRLDEFGVSHLRAYEWRPSG